ncbi:unnamed protein product [Rotaria sp. Silwood1]|nr:unnamed protein product [Rotaria sp. Silwood1]CAF1614636.1 unnamed protein product [Rotaria sp. Silwood1]CAF3734013.1 unnamed protein product [Rotaria sp. Silwood1]CAF3759237.1 unnamed protein product [Rotaria sp. Silwood1]CAF4910750.1 unnamed protein product [Rotaria sp. Silwood1]
MVGLRLLARLHEILTIAKSSDPSVPFGGINIVLFGDYMQYSPVLDKALFIDVFMESSSSMANSTSVSKRSLSEYEIQCQVGRALILQVNVVVKLTIQMRVDDTEYLGALDRLRFGECNMNDYELFRSLIIGRPGAIQSLSDIPWNDAPILVYRNEIRTELNNRAVINKCKELNHPLIVCVAQDKTKSKKIDTKNLHRLQNFLLDLPDNKTESLPGYLPLVPGMPVLLTDNVATELGLSNGTKGIFRQIVYEELDTSLTYTNTKFPKNTIFIRKPSYALLEVPKAKISTKFDSLEPQLVSISAVEKTFEVNVQSLLPISTSTSAKSNGNRAHSPASKITVTRKALPFIPAYSITTHKAQGQTMSKVVVDLRLPPGKEEVASRYVPLGRVKSRKDIAILQDFPFSALQVKPSKAQRVELDRLNRLNEVTLERYQTWKQ